MRLGALADQVPRAAQIFQWDDEMAQSTIWMSYDLGVQGDYQSLYAWLDDHNAKECGDSLAVLQYTHTGNGTDAMLKALGNELSKVLDQSKRTRIYVIYRDRTDNKNKGTFIFGGRRSPPWTGYGLNRTGEEDEEV